jgi:hypothetical protein
MSIAPHAGHDSQIMPEHNLHGTEVDARDPHMLRKAVDLALHYRGDVTITRRGSNETIEGYIFDCKTDRATGDQSVRIIPAGRDERITVPLADIAKLAFTGRDTASGKSFETWVKKYIEKKMAGESASIESETLD